MLPTIIGAEQTLDHIVAYTGVLVGTSFLLIPTGAVGPLYTVVAATLGMAALAGSVWLRRNPDQAIRFFVASNLYLAILFAAMAIDGLL